MNAFIGGHESAGLLEAFVLLMVHGMPTKAATALKKNPPPALARVDAREVAKKQKRLADEARADIALIQRRRQRITEDFYDVGEALLRLKRPGVAASLGYKSFA